MRNADLMTSDELRALADEKEDLNKIVKKGKLKHDLYSIPTNYGSSGLTFYKDTNHWLITNKEKNSIIKEFKEEFELVLEKGTPFIAYRNKDGSLSWYDDVNYGCEDQTDAWARENLTEIK